MHRLWIRYQEQGMISWLSIHSNQLEHVSHYLYFQLILTNAHVVQVQDLFGDRSSMVDYHVFMPGLCERAGAQEWGQRQVHGGGAVHQPVLRHGRDHRQG